MCCQRMVTVLPYTEAPTPKLMLSSILGTCPFSRVISIHQGKRRRNRRGSLPVLRYLLTSGARALKFLRLPSFESEVL